MTPNQFESLQQDLNKIDKLKQHIRYCYECMIEVREMRSALASVKSPRSNPLKITEKFWKRAYWKAAEQYERNKIK